MFLLFYRLFCGYLYVRVTAKNPEKLLNICAAKGINIWRVTLKNNILYFKIGIGSFKRLRIFMRNIPCRLHITKKVGFPFFAARNKKRYGMVVGMVMFFVILNVMSGYVWNICISGNNNVDSADIVNSLNEIGIYEGAKISSVDPEEKRNELLLVQEGISWAAINIEGSKLTVDVVETKITEDKDTSPSNLKATEDGIITKIEVKNGVTQVKVGQVVEKGQLLVSGINEYTDGKWSLVRSEGSICAEVKRSVKIVQPLTVTEYLKNGVVEKRKVLRFFGLEIPLYFGSVKGDYEAKAAKKEISGGEAYLPVEIVNKTFYKTEKTTYKLSEEQALERAEKQAEAEILKVTSGGEIIERKEKKTVDDNYLTLEIELNCVKDIVFEEKLQLDTSN